jgi:hypothetical protein
MGAIVIRTRFDEDTESADVATSAQWSRKKRTKGQTAIYKTLQRKGKIEQH